MGGGGNVVVVVLGATLGTDVGVATSESLEHAPSPRPASITTMSGARLVIPVRLEPDGSGGPLRSASRSRRLRVEPRPGGMPRGVGGVERTGGVIPHFHPTEVGLDPQRIDPGSPSLQDSVGGFPAELHEQIFEFSDLLFEFVDSLGPLTCRHIRHGTPLVVLPRSRIQGACGKEPRSQPRCDRMTFGPTGEARTAASVASDGYPKEKIDASGISYAGRMTITVIADPDACPDLPALHSALQAELDQLTATDS